MKKFFMVLSILILTLSISSVAFAKEFSDVKNTKYSDSVKMLTDLEVISGYEDNTFKPNNQIKRSEMAKLLIVALGKQADVKTTVTTQTFPDVAKTHWAAGYIELASQLDLIKGYPNGKFAPDDKVSYVEAVALMLRALNYNKEIEDLTWPDGYMKKASDVKLLKSVTYDNANDDATRGEISNMLWNTLNAYTRTIVATNTDGKNVYGNGKKMLEKSFPNKYTSITDSVITDIDLIDMMITVKIDGKTKEFLYEDATETSLKKMFGRTIETALYDTKNDEFLSIELDDDETVVTGTVTKISSGKIYIGSKSYTIPDEDDIKLIGTSDINDAEKAYIVMDGSKVKAMLIEGTETLYVGLVTDTSVTIDDEDGIELEHMNGDEEKYILNDSKAKIYEGDVIVYALNSDDELILRKAFDYDDGLEIESVTSTSIKLKGKDKVTFSKSDDYIVVMVNYEDSIEEGELDDIYEKYDSALVQKINDTTFVFVFVDGLDEIEDDDDDNTMTKTEAKNALNSAIKTAKAKKEANYTIASWAKLKTALDEANKINTSTATASKMQTAAEKLNNAVKNLKTVTTADKNLRTKFNNLQTLIKDAEELKKEDYTTESYAKVTTALTAAKKIVITSTTVAKVETATSNLDSAIKLLVTNTTAENMATAKARLEKAKTDAAAIKKEDYTEETYKVLEDAVKAASDIDYTKDGSAVINNVARNIEEALVALVSKADDEKAKAISALKSLVTEARTLETNKAKYTEKTWKKVQEELDELEVYDDVYTTLTTTQIKTHTSTLKAAIDALEEVLKRDNLISQLEGVITLAEKQAEDAWIGSSTWAEFQTALTEAKAVYEASESKTYSQLEAAYNKLCECLGI
ncbi:MAG: S-layer homology domain-containing protein [Clostridia bacterium]|nr:S-layer homology domain-containing protein [Clostridia bacterium]